MQTTYNLYKEVTSNVDNEYNEYDGGDGKKDIPLLLLNVYLVVLPWSGHNKKFMDLNHCNMKHLALGK